MLIPHQKLVIEPLDVIKPLFKKPKETIFSDYISNKKVYLTGSGRAALKTIIESNNFKKIGVPAFTCCAVELAIKSAKALPVFIDSHIIPEIKDYPKIDALVLPYNFGFLPNIEKIKKDCKKRNIALIEDCCQALGATYNNKLVGSFGDYSFYSFGISKNIGLLGGALGSAKQEKLNLKSYPKKEIVSALTKGLIAKYVFNPKFYSKKLIQKELVKDQKELNYSMPSFIKKIILIQLERYNEILYQRRKNAKFCLKELEGIIDFVKPLKNTNPAWLYFVLLDKKREEIIKRMYKEKVDVQPLLTFRDLSKTSKLATKAENEHFAFALYRPETEIESIVKKIKNVMQKI